MKKTIVGVTGPVTRFPIAWWFIRFAVWVAGGKAVRLTVNTGFPRTQPDAVIISGGDDIDSALYLPGDESAPPPDPARDQFEIQMIKRCFVAGTPLLGICRGAQLINVVRGGSLHTDIRSLRKWTSNERHLRAKKAVDLTKSSVLTGVFKSERIFVNSLHYQACDRMGSHLTVVGRDADNIVQAFESEQSDEFVVGVQWHPEYLPHHRRQRALFAALVNAAKQSHVS